MKVSIITVCYNSSKTIEDTIKSVLSQSYENIEYIVVDGNSNDGTQAIIEKYRNQIAHYVSEPDKGMYDGINKGIRTATGDIIGILNSDDIYKDETIIGRVAKRMTVNKTDALYGDLKYVKADDLNKTVRYWKSGPFKRGKFLFGWMPPHPTFFLKREVYEEFGGYLTNFRSAADYELMLRMLFRHRISVSYLPKVMVLMREGGLSNQTLENRINANKEDKKAWMLNDLRGFFFTTWLKPVRKIPQFLVWGR